MFRGRKTMQEDMSDRFAEERHSLEIDDLWKEGNRLSIELQERLLNDFNY